MKLNTETYNFPDSDARSRAMENAAQNIDATLFNGDPDPQMRQTLRNLMARWERKLVEWDKFDEEFAKEDLSEEGLATIQAKFIAEKTAMQAKVKKPKDVRDVTVGITLVCDNACSVCKKVMLRDSVVLYSKKRGFLCDDCAV